MSMQELPRFFRERLKELEAIIDQEEFCVLVWGSGKSKNEDYKKRLKICQYLKERFGRDQVLMSEDDAFKDLVDKHGLRTSEALQAIAADAIIIFDTSIGPHSEILLFEDILLGKTLVFVPRDLKESGSFATAAFEVIKNECYLPEQYEDCTEIRRKANAFAQGLRFNKAKGEGKLRRS